jgi:hypothetical protein
MVDELGNESRFEATSQVIEELKVTLCAVLNVGSGKFDELTSRGNQKVGEADITWRQS